MLAISTSKFLAPPKGFRMQMKMAFGLSKNHWFEVQYAEICSQMTHQSVSLGFVLSPNTILACKALTNASSPWAFKIRFYLQRLKGSQHTRKTHLSHIPEEHWILWVSFPVDPDGGELTDSGEPTDDCLTVPTGFIIEHCMKSQEIWGLVPVRPMKTQGWCLILFGFGVQCKIGGLTNL